MSELNDRLESLATRGTRRGADDVVGAALETARGTEGRSGQGGGDAGAGMTGDLDVVTTNDHGREPPVMMMEDARARRTRRPWRTALTAGGLAAVLGVATMGIAALIDRGGSDSPEGAVRQFADAISHEDPLAAVHVLNPDEVAGLATLVDETAKRAEELDLVNDAAAPLAGVDLSLGDLDLSTETLADGYVKVYVRGEELSFRAKRDELSPMIQRAWTDERDELDNDMPIADLVPDGQDPFVVAVERDGGWYVSPAYTVLEYIRANENGPAADYGSGTTQALGADSPEQAARDALESYSTGNWDRLWELMAPSEVPLYDYRATLAQALAETGAPNFTIDDFSPTVQVDGDRAYVTVNASGQLADGQGPWSIDEKCFVSGADSSDYGQFSLCPGGGGGGLIFGLGNFGTSDGAADSAGLRFTAVQRNGRWYLSPVGTFTDVLTRMIQSIDDRELATTLGLQADLPPDGALTLGQPVTSPSSVAAGVSYVYTFEGRKGQEVIGKFESSENLPDDYEYGGDGFLIGPDGRRLDSGWGVLSGYSAELPADGTYRLAVMSYAAAPFTVTLYDKEGAPEGLLDEYGPSGECTYDSATGETTCTSTGSGFEESTVESGGVTGELCSDPSTTCPTIATTETSIAVAGN